MQSLTWSEALRAAQGPGGAVVAGIIISVLIEFMPAFAKLESKFKTAAYVGLCVAVPVLASVLAIATGEFGAWGDVAGTWWPAVWSGIGAAGVGTLVHAWKPQALKQ